MGTTKQQARLFRECTETGERPAAPEWVFFYLGLPGLEIKRDIQHTITNATHGRRMVQMGLVDKDYNTTELGYEYLSVRTNQSGKGTYSSS